MRTRKPLSIGFNPLRDDIEVPQIKTQGSAGADIVIPDDVTIEPFSLIGKGTLVPLGFSLDIPEGMQVHIMLRSSVGLKTPIRLSNGVGLIDSDYKGELCLLLDNLSKNSIHIKSGTRIAQLVPFPTLKWEFELIVTHTGERKHFNPIQNTKRSGGFGSTTRTKGDKRK